MLTFQILHQTLRNSLTISLIHCQVLLLILCWNVSQLKEHGRKKHKASLHCISFPQSLEYDSVHVHAKWIIIIDLNLISLVPLCYPFSRVMCFHPWSDVTLPLMSIDEILEVIREWIRQYQEISKTYRWTQVIISCKISVIFAIILLLILNIKFCNSDGNKDGSSSGSRENGNSNKNNNLIFSSWKF